MSKPGSRPSARDSDVKRADPRERALYALSPAKFVAARDALARELGAEGKPDAARVKALRRPTVAAWLLNAVAHERWDIVAALLGAADRLREAQTRSMQGDATELRTASAAFHYAVGTVLDAAREKAASEGSEAGATLLADVERGLRSVPTASTAIRNALLDGVLERVPESGGLEFLATLEELPPPKASPKQPRVPGRGTPGTAGIDRADRARNSEAAVPKTENARLLRERRRAAAEAERLDRERRRALAEAHRLDSALEAADARVHDAERLVADAQRRLAAARKDAERAREHARAARARAEATDTTERARRPRG